MLDVKIELKKKVADTNVPLCWAIKCEEILYPNNIIVFNAREKGKLKTHIFPVSEIAHILVKEV